MQENQIGAFIYLIFNNDACKQVFDNLLLEEIRGSQVFLVIETKVIFHYQKNLKHHSMHFNFRNHVFYFILKKKRKKKLLLNCVYNFFASF